MPLRMLAYASFLGLQYELPVYSTVLYLRPPAGMTGETWAEKCVEITLSARVDNQTRATLLFALSIFGSLVHSPELFQTLISEEIMQESPFYEVVMQRGIEQGARETSIRNILAVLTARFPQHDPQPAKQALEAISDTDLLMQLLQTAALTPTFEAFLQAADA